MRLQQLLSGTALIVGAAATPMIQLLEHRHAKPHPDRWERSALPMPLEAESETLSRRDSKTIDISKSWVNQTLFQSTLLSLPPSDGVHAAIMGQMIYTNINLTCRECYTKGTVGYNFSMGDNLTAENVIEALTTDSKLGDLIKPVMRVDLSNVEVFVDMDMSVSGAFVYNWRLATFLLSPFSIYEKNILQLGPTLSIDLVFVAASAVDITTGFHMTLPPDAFLEIDVEDGSIVNHLLKGTVTKTLPMQIKWGDTAWLIVDLRLTAAVDVNPGRSINPGNYKPLPGDNNVTTRSLKEFNLLERAQPDNHGQDLQLRDRRSLLSKIPKGKIISHILRLGAGIGVQAFINVAEWTIEFKLDTKNQSTCALQVANSLNLNVGAAWYAAILLRHAMVGFMPRTSWKLLESKPTTTCVYHHPAKTPISTAVNTTASTAPAPTPSGMVVVQQVLTTCNAPIVNCPESLMGTVTVNNTVDAAYASTLTQTSDTATETQTDGLGHRIESKLHSIFGRSNDDDGELVQWLPLETPVLMSITSDLALTAPPALETTI